MKFVNPSLVLTYTEDNSTSTITDEYIVKDSIKITERWLNGLESSSNTVQLQLHQDCPDIIANSMSILKSNSDIKAILYDGSSPVFTGYLSDGQSWGISNKGERALTIGIEDIGTRLLPKPFIRDGGKVVLEGSADTIVRQIATAAGITLDPGFPVISTKVLKVVEIGEKCQDLLKKLMKEVGYAYYFTSTGKLSARKIDCTSTSGVPVLNKDDLWVKNDNGLVLSKKMRQYKSSKITYKSVKKRYETYIYKDISGQDDSHPYCNIELEAHQTYPDPDGNPSYITAEDLMSGNEVVYIENVVPEVEISTERAIVESEIEQFGADTLSVLLTCVSTGEDPNKAIVSKLQAKADIMYVEAENDVIGGEVVSSDVSDNMIEEECEWIHTKDAADKLANLYVDYYKFCNKQFTFYTKTNIECGAIVKVWDDLYSGLAVNVMVIGKTYDDSFNVFSYTAVSISEFDLTKPTTTTTTYAAPSSVNISGGASQSLFFDVNLSSGIYKRNLRKSINQELLVAISINGYTETSAEVTVSNGSFDPVEDIKTVVISPGEVKTLYIPFDNLYDSITIRGLLNAITEVRKVISAINETDKWVYLGSLTSIPSPGTYGYDKFAIGDHFLAASSWVESSITFEVGNVYCWTGETWALVSADLSDAEGNTMGVDFYSAAMSNALDDAVDVNAPGTSQLGAWIKRLAAKQIVADEIMAKELIMTTTGSLRSAQYAEVEGFPTSGYKLESNSGTLKAMNANLRDVNIKCTDSQNQILLQTQRYQQGTENIAVRNNSLSARWCIDDAESEVGSKTLKTCTYNNNSRYIYRAENVEYDYGYRYFIAELWRQSGGRTHDGYSYGECLYTFPIPGYYYAVIYGYINTAQPGYILSPSGYAVTSNVGTMYVDLGYHEAGSQFVAVSCYQVDMYLYSKTRLYEVTVRNSVTTTYSGGWGNWPGTTTFTGYSYIPEEWIESGSYMNLPLLVGNFNSSNYRDYYAVSNTLASWAEGSYNTVNSTVSGNGQTLSVANIGKTSTTISFRDNSYNVITVSLPVDTNNIALTGWYKNLSGNINLISQQSGILTYNVLPSRNQSCSCGTTGQAWAEVVSYGFNSLSSRAEKKDIERYEDNATEIINGTEIVSFKYKNDEQNTPKVGFIADDTNSLMSGPEHNKFDLNNAVGLLLKAVQELSARIDKLEK